METDEALCNNQTKRIVGEKEQINSYDAAVFHRFSMPLTEPHSDMNINATFESQSEVNQMALQKEPLVQDPQM